MSNFVKEVNEFAKEILEENTKLSSFEALQIAVKIQQNKILSQVFMLSMSDKEYPSALEAIAIALGYNQNYFNK
jgi:hypothetical protein